MGGSLDGLQAAIDAMRAACQAASTSLAANACVIEDMPLIAGQVERAKETVTAVGAILDADGDRDELFLLLHQVNNQLTGVLALTLLVKDDIGASHPSRAALDALDRSSRNAATHVKDVATLLRSSSSAASA